MKEEMDRLKIQNAELQSQSAEAQRYGAMLGFINAHTEVPDGGRASDCRDAPIAPAILSTLIEVNEDRH